MPCDTVTTVQAEMSHASVDILKRALESLGYTVRVSGDTLTWDYGRASFIGGRLTARSEAEVVRIKRAYGAETVKTQAKRFGWRVKELANGQYEVMK